MLISFEKLYCTEGEIYLKNRNVSLYHIWYDLRKALTQNKSGNMSVNVKVVNQEETHAECSVQPVDGATILPLTSTNFYVSLPLFENRTFPLSMSQTITTMPPQLPKII